jgi:Oxygenase domain of the 2OGFeDO superfamily
MGDNSSSSWRLAGFSDNFEIFGRGIKTFSPGWFMQGHDVSLLVTYEYELKDSQNLASKLHASTSLQNRNGAEFMTKIAEVEKLCNTILLLTCPELHDTGMKALDKVRAGKNMHREYNNVELWPSCFTGMQVIVNRTTPSHRDKGGSPPLFDLLVSAGTHTSAKFILPEIGLELSYLPGAVVILCGRIFLHKVPGWDGGERICVAHMMKDNVHDRQDIARPSWPMQSRYLSHVRL